VHEASLITLEQISNVMSNFYECLVHYQMVEERHCKHLINWKNGNQYLKSYSHMHARTQ